MNHFIQLIKRRDILELFLLLGILVVFICVVLTSIRHPSVTNSVSIKMEIPNTASSWAIRFYEAAKKQIGIVKTYDFSNGYYSSNNGYPPLDTGVCSDTVARAFDTMGFGTLREKVDADMQANPKVYRNTFDTYVNFRRVRNLDTFLSRHAKTLPLEILSGNRENLWQWQVGDIVVFDENPIRKLMHIGIISDIRQEDGVPYMIDNHGYGTDIRMTPLDWPTPIVGHYRYF